jgi:hypothetical protein
MSSTHLTALQSLQLVSHDPAGCTLQLPNQQLSLHVNDCAVDGEPERLVAPHNLTAVTLVLNDKGWSVLMGVVAIPSMQQLSVALKPVEVLPLQFITKMLTGLLASTPPLTCLSFKCIGRLVLLMQGGNNRRSPAGAWFSTITCLPAFAFKVVGLTAQTRLTQFNWHQAGGNTVMHRREPVGPWPIAGVLICTQEPAAA